MLIKRYDSLAANCHSKSLPIRWGGLLLFYDAYVLFDTVGFCLRLLEAMGASQMQRSAEKCGG